MLPLSKFHFYFQIFKLFYPIFGSDRFCRDMKKAFIQLHFAILLAGFTGILGKLITLKEGWLVWYRMLITSVALFLLFYFTGRLKRISRQDYMKIFGVGTILAMHWVTFYGSINYSNVSVALVCFSATGFFTAIFEPILEKRRESWQELLLGFMVIIGIYIIFHFDPQYKTGIILGIISASLAALFPIFNGQFLKKHSPETVTFYELSGGFIALSILMPIYIRFFPSERFIPNTSDFLWLLVLALFCTVLAFQLSLAALKKISAFTVNLSYNLEPVYGILLAFLVYRENEKLNNSFYIGLGIILLSVGLQTWRVSRSRKV